MPLQRRWRREDVNQVATPVKVFPSYVKQVFGKRGSGQSGSFGVMAVRVGVASRRFSLAPLFPTLAS